MTGSSQAADVQQEGLLSSKDAEGRTIHSYINAKGETLFITEAALPVSWPYTDIKPDGNVGETSSTLYEHRQQEIFKSLAAAFEWGGEPIDPKSVYNAADPKNSFHAEWLKYQNKVGKSYAPASVPYVLQNAKADGLDMPKDNEGFDAYAQRLKGASKKECRYWPLGTCKNGDKCDFYHDPVKAPNAGAPISNMYWRPKQGMRTKSAAA
ncbi:hypothetical protein SLS60_004254 [Paraconiothyrium brasiliense]|uniref:C3H1-type domain-containing protein n=1 Tax=Paraconiothyrium brasiliense TaxID=300254 RepID=A0ABR3RQX8_9PLEO